jgi:hypothetical protein
MIMTPALAPDLRLHGSAVILGFRQAPGLSPCDAYVHDDECQMMWMTLCVNKPNCTTAMVPASFLACC